MEAKVEALDEEKVFINKHQIALLFTTNDITQLPWRDKFTAKINKNSRSSNGKTLRTNFDKANA
jgi:hypothetical protein